MNSKPFAVSARFAGIALLAALLAGCNQQHNSQNRARGGGHGLRMACAADIQKFCANDQRKRRCLKDNVDKLSDSCKAALERRGGKRDKGNKGGDNDND
ncbi:MAG: hypothetical protein ACREHV_08860 [Rhizomicrobium sp.]